MLVFPNCKINLGLHVLNKRQDGYHSIETVFYPVNWCDALEVIENKKDKTPFTWSQTGIEILGEIENNLIYKAWKLITEHKKIPPIAVHLHKTIPMGAGLGGGSSDAAHFIELLDKKYTLQLDYSLKLHIASQLGSDCAFFLRNNPVFAEEKGDQFSTIQLDLSEYYILVVYPNIHSNTKEAYDGLIPKIPKHPLKQIITTQPLANWKNTLSNDFEVSIFKKYPKINLLKEHMYASGAIYSSLSGSGSSVFGIFKEQPVISFPKDYSFYLQKPEIKIL